MNPTPYRARHLGDSYNLTHAEREVVAEFSAVLAAPLPALGKHASYPTWEPVHPETRRPLEAAERAA